MKLLSRKKKPTIESEVARIVEHLCELDPGSEEYKLVVSNLKILKEAGAFKTNDQPTGDVIVTVIANLVGLFSIMKYERLDVLSAKALGWLIKLKT